MDPVIKPVSPRKAYMLVGPTAVGKTAVAQWIAERKGWPILSADSMLVYRGMNIGTAKPSVAERGCVPYWGLDLVNPSETFSVARFLEEAGRCLDSLAPDQGVIAVGGTGLYFRGLIEGLETAPVSLPESRARWQGLLEAEGIGGLQRALRERNQAWYEALSVADKQNSRRLIRALEGHEAGLSGPPQSWRRGNESPVVVGLSMPREELVLRIEERVTAMYRDGLLDETRDLIKAGSDLSPTAAHAIGYAEAMACLGGGLSRAEAIELTVIRTRQLVKRQMTWFRRQMSIQWVHIGRSTPVEAAAASVLEAWDTVGATPLGI